MLENEFGTKNSDEVVRKILEEGDVQDTKVRCVGHLGWSRETHDAWQSKAREGDRNQMNGPLIGGISGVHN